jgi:hypothetical protein
MRVILFFLITASSIPLAFADDSACLYQTSEGEIKKVRSLSDVPYEYRKAARCLKPGQSAFLANPEEISLKGNLRREDISTSIGRMKIRWPRKVEKLFGRTPMRAVTDVAETVSRALKTSAFPPFVQNLDTNWQIVFLDEDLPEAEIPANLVKNCHPGWMTPPANIYIVAQRVAGDCSGRKKQKAVADEDLAEVLLHEFGHAVEFHLLRSAFGGNRARAEGFATWFETFASKYSNVVSETRLRQENYRLARTAIERSPGFTFSGYESDYARASMYFVAIVNRSGVNGLMKIYRAMATQKTPFFEAAQSELNMNYEKIEEEIAKILQIQ